MITLHEKTSQKFLIILRARLLEIKYRCVGDLKMII